MERFDKLLAEYGLFLRIYDEDFNLEKGLDSDIKTRLGQSGEYSNKHSQMFLERSIGHKGVLKIQDFSKFCKKFNLEGVLKYPDWFFSESYFFYYSEGEKDVLRFELGYLSWGRIYDDMDNGAKYFKGIQDEIKMIGMFDKRKAKEALKKRVLGVCANASKIVNESEASKKLAKELVELVKSESEERMKKILF